MANQLGITSGLWLCGIVVLAYLVRARTLDEQEELLSLTNPVRLCYPVGLCYLVVWTLFVFVFSVLEVEQTEPWLITLRCCGGSLAECFFFTKASFTMDPGTREDRDDP